ncbi:hypothetical protein [Demequina oxidasica]|uniref:hypothetical protein n=1 Tax=Demequina oxidasica TaxID=676199 RepID=UPI000783A881|nr:hypothetical protein [Demequina oxidasica]
MRWNDLFADLEGQLGAGVDAQFATDVAERTRGERAAIPFASRLAAGVGCAVMVTLADGEKVSGLLTEVAATWILVNEERRQSWIPTRAIVAVVGLKVRAADLSAVARGLTMGHALRALSRDRAQVVIVTTSGTWPGVIAQVGADYVEIGNLKARTTTVVPFGTIVRVTSVGFAGE